MNKFPNLYAPVGTDSYIFSRVSKQCAKRSVRDRGKAEYSKTDQFHKGKDGSEKGDKESTEVEVQATPSYDDPPDGGLRAWLVVLGVSRLLFQD